MNVEIYIYLKWLDVTFAVKRECIWHSSSDEFNPCGQCKGHDLFLKTTLLKQDQKCYGSGATLCVPIKELYI